MPSHTGNIVRNGQPSRSALRVAQLRAVHQLLDEPTVLFDPIALPILGQQMEESLRENPFDLNDPISRGLRAALVARSRFAEDELARAVATGVRQYVILGAGLDTFAYRNPHSAAGLRVFEVDHPSTQQWKHQCLVDAGIPLPDTLRFVPMDFEHDLLSKALAQAGFCADKPACFSWLGVTVYLSPQAVRDTLAYVASLPVGSSITFDYRVHPSLLDPVGQAIVGVIGKQIAAFGEPWVSSFDPTQLQHQLSELGFSNVEDPGADLINSRYFARRKDGLRCSASFRQACAHV